MSVLTSPNRVRLALDPTSQRVPGETTPWKLDGEALEQWQQVATSAPLPTALPSWTIACIGAFNPGASVHVVDVRDGADLTARCVLTPRPEDPAVLVQPGCAEFYEPTDLVARDPVALHRLSDALVRLGRPIELIRVPADTATLAAIRHASRRRAIVRCSPAPGAPRIELDASWQHPAGRMSSRRRADLRRARRRADEIGPVEFESMLPGPTELDALLDEAERVEASGWKGRAGTALAHDTAMRAALREFAHGAAAGRRLRLSFMRIGSDAAAMQIAVEHAGAQWVLKVGFDERFSSCSPGMLLTAHTIGSAAARGLRAFELQGCSEPWTRAFTTLERPTVAVRIYPVTALGLAAGGRDGVRLARRRLQRPGDEPDRA